MHGVLADLPKLDRFFARSVMGWTIYRPKGCYTDWWVQLRKPMSDDYAFRHARVDDWKPTKSSEQAFGIIGKFLSETSHSRLELMVHPTPGAILQIADRPGHYYAVAPSLHLAALFVIAQALDYDEYAPEPVPEPETP